MKPRRWRETRNTITHKQSGHRAMHEVIELGSWEGRGDQMDGPWFWPLTRQIREHESLNTNTDLSKSRFVSQTYFSNIEMSGSRSKVNPDAVSSVQQHLDCRPWDGFRNLVINNLFSDI